jgi:uncharacterized membrane protein (DUF2068 family)
MASVMGHSGRLLRAMWDSLRDLLPMLVVIGFFQVVVLRQALPDLASIVGGILLVVLGLTLFIQGLTLGLFPLGDSLAAAFARKGSVPWLLAFAFALGFATTVAEPTLTAVAGEAARVAAADGTIVDSEAARASYAQGLRYTVAVAVGCALVLGVLRILKGWPIHYLIIGGYAAVLAMTPFAPPEVLGIAYDSGAVTTSTVTVPLMTALGVGLATSIEGRSPMVDGFGLIAFASLTPMPFVMVYGLLA